MTPVRTSPVPAVARLGIAAVDEDARSRRCDQRAGALEQDDAAEALDRAAHGLEPVRVHPRRLLADQPAQLAGVRRQDARRGPLGRLERPERVAVDHGRQLRLGEHAPHERLRALAAPEAGADRERSRLRGELQRRCAAASSVTSPSRPRAAAA